VMKTATSDPTPVPAQRRRRSTLAIVLVCAVIWIGFLVAELPSPQPIPVAGVALRKAAERHDAAEAHNPLSRTGSLEPSAEEGR
jgi:hypothetical protein